jgi:hypothetical protein
MVNQIISGLMEKGLIESHPLSQEAEDPPVRFAFSNRGDGWFYTLDAVIAIGSIDVAVFKRGC